MICIQPPANNPRLEKRSERERRTLEGSFESFPSDDGFFEGDFKNQNSIEWAESALREDSIHDPFAKPQHQSGNNHHGRQQTLDDIPWKAKFDRNSSLHLSADSFTDLAAKRAPSHSSSEEQDDVFSTSQAPSAPSSPTARSPRQARRASLNHFPGSSGTRLLNSPKRGGKRRAKSPRASRILPDGRIERTSPRTRDQRRKKHFPVSPSVGRTESTATKDTFSPSRVYRSPQRHSSPRKQQEMKKTRLLERSPAAAAAAAFPEKQNRRRSTGMDPAPLPPPTVATTNNKAQRRSSTGFMPEPRKLISPRNHHLMASPRNNNNNKWSKANEMLRDFEKQGLVVSPGKPRGIDQVMQHCCVVTSSSPGQPTERKQQHVSSPSGRSIASSSTRKSRSPKRLTLRPVNKRSPQKERSPRRRLHMLGSIEELNTLTEGSSPGSKFRKKTLTLSAKTSKSRVTTPHAATKQAVEGLLLEHLSSIGSPGVLTSPRHHTVRPKRASMPLSSMSTTHHPEDERSVCTSMSAAQRRMHRKSLKKGGGEKDNIVGDDAAPKQPTRCRSRSPDGFLCA